MHVLLDPRQSTLCTTVRDAKYKKNYEAHKILDLYREWERKGLLSITYENETHRSAPAVARFSDIILGPNIGLEATVSNVSPRGRHDGIYVIAKDSIPEYSCRHEATLLATQQSEQYDAVETINFKKSKGLTREDVIVVASGPIEQFLLKGRPLKSHSACGFYVAATRARYSVAIAVRNPARTLKAMNTPSSMWHDVGARPEEP